MSPISPFRIVVIGSALAGCAAITGVGDLEIGPDVSASAPDAGQATADDGSSVDRTNPPDDGSAFDSTLDGAASCPSFASFCDDFESGNLTKWTSLLQTNSGKVSIVDMPVFAGKHSLHVIGGPSTPAGNVYPAVGAAARVSVPVVASGMIVARARVYMPKILAAETTFIKIFGKNGVDDMNVKIDNGGLVKEDTDVPDEGPEITGTKVAPIASWFCIEWQATIAAVAGASGHQKVIVDGETAIDVDENNFSSDGYDAVQFGFHASNGQVTQEVYFDDVVTATQPIGCK